MRRLSSVLSCSGSVICVSDPDPEVVEDSKGETPAIEPTPPAEEVHLEPVPAPEAQEAIEEANDETQVPEPEVEVPVPAEEIQEQSVEAPVEAVAEPPPVQEEALETTPAVEIVEKVGKKDLSILRLLESKCKDQVIGIAFKLAKGLELVPLVALLHVERSSIPHNYFFQGYPSIIHERCQNHPTPRYHQRRSKLIYN